MMKHYSPTVELRWEIKHATDIGGYPGIHIPESAGFFWVLTQKYFSPIVGKEDIWIPVGQWSKGTD